MSCRIEPSDDWLLMLCTSTSRREVRGGFMERLEESWEAEVQ